MSSSSSVAKEIVAAVKRTGTRHVFCVPGESYLATLQAFGEDPDITVVSARHEEGAGLMAEAYAKATGKTGVCLVTRGPGLTHLTIALHTAQQDSTPMLAIVGQVPNSVRYRESFQEMEIAEFCRPVSKWAAELNVAERVPELVSRALYLSSEGRPGPVVLSLPEDIDRAECAAPNVGEVKRFRAATSQAGIDTALDLLHAAKRPCIVAGGGVLKDGAGAELIEFAEAISAPVYSGWRRFDVFPNSHPLYLGPLPTLPRPLYAPLYDADVIVAVGTRFDEFTSLAYGVPTSDQKLLFIAESPHSVEAFDAASNAVVLTSDTLNALRQLNAQLATIPRDDPKLNEIAEAKQAYVTATTPSATPVSGAKLNLEAVMADLVNSVPTDTRITSDAGMFAGWLYRFFKWEEPGTFFGSTAGGMGYAVPSAIGVKLENPSKPVIAFAGDGGFAMTMSELETAVRHQLAGLVFLVFDNARYGTIAKHQDNAGMGGSVGTSLGEINFAGVAESMGAQGFTVTRTEDFATALASALSASRPAVIHLVMDNDTLDPWQSYSKGHK